MSPNDEEFPVNLSSELVELSKAGDLEGIRRTIACGGDPKYLGSGALRWAAMNGHADCVEFLIPLSEPKDHESLALFWATDNGHFPCVSLLVSVSDVETVKCKLTRDGRPGKIVLIDAAMQKSGLMDKSCERKKEPMRTTL